MYKFALVISIHISFKVSITSIYTIPYSLTRFNRIPLFHTRTLSIYTISYVGNSIPLSIYLS